VRHPARSSAKNYGVREKTIYLRCGLFVVRSKDETLGVVQLWYDLRSSGKTSDLSNMSSLYGDHAGRQVDIPRKIIGNKALTGGRTGDYSPTGSVMDKSHAKLNTRSLFQSRGNTVQAGRRYRTYIRNSFSLSFSYPYCIKIQDMTEPQRAHQRHRSSKISIQNTSGASIHG